MIKLKGRSIIIPLSERGIGVSLDNLSEEKLFSVPRYYGDIDLYAATPYIKTQSEGDGLNKFPLMPILTEDMILLTWRVPKNCLKENGRLYFQLQFEIPSPDSCDIVVWQSEKSFFTIEETIPADGFIDEESRDILQQLTAQVEDLAVELENRAVPTGGKAGEVFTKLSEKDMDFGWLCPPVPSAASNNQAGLVIGDGQYTSISQGKMRVLRADRLKDACSLGFSGGDVTGDFIFDGSSVEGIKLSIGQGKVTEEMLAELSIDDSQQVSGSGSLRVILGSLAAQIKHIIGSSNWQDLPAESLVNLAGRPLAAAQRLAFTADSPRWSGTDGSYTLDLDTTLLPIAVYKLEGNGRHNLVLADIELAEGKTIIKTTEKFSGLVAAI